MSAEDKFAAYVKELKVKLYLGGATATIHAILTIALHVVELRARVARLEAAR